MSLVMAHNGAVSACQAACRVLARCRVVSIDVRVRAHLLFCAVPSAAHDLKSGWYCGGMACISNEAHRSRQQSHGPRCCACPPPCVSRVPNSSNCERVHCHRPKQDMSLHQMRHDLHQMQVSFSYSVKWKDSATEFDHRMDRYAKYSFLPQHLEACAVLLLLGRHSCCKCPGQEQRMGLCRSARLQHDAAYTLLLQHCVAQQGACAAYASAEQQDMTDKTGTLNARLRRLVRPACSCYPAWSHMLCSRVPTSYLKALASPVRHGY
jgi:hypothetical protein